MTHESARLEGALWAVKKAPSEQTLGGGATSVAGGDAAALRERFRWAVRIRWLAIGGFLALGMAAFAAGVLRDPWPCLAAACTAALLNAVNQLAVQRWRWVGAVTLLAVFGDVLLITYLVAATGGTSSPFVAMYGVQVLAAAMLVEVRLAVGCAAAAVAALAAAVTIVAPAGALMDVAATAFFPVWTGFFAFGLGMVAYVGGHVSAQLRQRENALEEANADLGEALLSVRRGNADLRATVDRLEQTERQLAQSEKMRALGDFVAGVAHELNNPIAIVAANLQILELELSAGGGDTRAQAIGEVLRDCEEAAARAARIVTDLRQFSRASGARHWQVVDVNDRVTRTVDLARHLFGAGVAIELSLHGQPLVRGVGPEIDQVLLNLLSNAAQAIGEAGGVRVSTEVVGGSDGSRVLLRVADDGPGVPADLADRIFEPFYTTRPEGLGVGPGLSLSFAIVERHGGTLRVDPTVTSGACFEISLPIDAEPVHPPGGMA